MTLWRRVCNVGRNISESKKLLGEAFEELRLRKLYTIKFHFLDHLSENKSRSEVLEVLDSFRLKHFIAQEKDAYQARTR